MSDDTDSMSIEANHAPSIISSSIIIIARPPVLVSPAWGPLAQPLNPFPSANYPYAMYMLPTAASPSLLRCFFLKTLRTINVEPAASLKASPNEHHIPFPLPRHSFRGHSFLSLTTSLTSVNIILFTTSPPPI